jgi:hypothetical protein
VLGDSFFLMGARTFGREWNQIPPTRYMQRLSYHQLRRGVVEHT